MAPIWCLRSSDVELLETAAAAVFEMAETVGGTPVKE